MQRGVWRAVLAAALLGMTFAVPAAPAAPPAAAPLTLTGTYAVLAKDVETAEGGFEHAYQDVLRVPGRAVPIRLPAGHGLTSGDEVTISALSESDGTTPLNVTSVRQLKPAAEPAPGVVSVIVILAYWTAPDSVTTASATSKVFGDAHQWFREVSYAKTGLTGVVTPWVRIPRPSTGRCYADGEEILANASAKAAGMGGKYSPSLYSRTIVYFPRCAGGDTAGVAGWAYEPGDVAWLNGYLDRRTIVHEQGHNYGMGHARALSCTSATGTKVMLSSRCTTAEYGDPFDAMGRSAYAAHYSGIRKEAAGWLGNRRRVMATSSSTFTLPPFERPSTLPLVVVARSPKVLGREYWLEYRRPVGMDARLPTGATGGVLVHLQDTTRAGLLDASPRDNTFTTAVIRPGTSWTAPDYVKISVGTVSSTGARVTVTGASAAPTPPTVPRSFVATPGDEFAKLSWTAPASNGRAPIQSYEIWLTPPSASGAPRVHVQAAGDALRTTVNGLRNDLTYSVRIQARNEIGLSPAATATVAPYYQTPTVRLVAPTGGAVVRGAVTLTATATPHPVGKRPIDCVRFLSGWDELARVCRKSGTVSTTWSSGNLPNGAYPLRVVATDEGGRVAESPTITIHLDNPPAKAALTTPVAGAVIDVSQSALESSVTVAGAPVTVQEIAYYDVTDGGHQYLGGMYYWWDSSFHPPYRIAWNTNQQHGPRLISVRAVVRDTVVWSDPVQVTLNRPPPTAKVTAPAADGSVSGTTTTLTATAGATARDASIYEVAFYAGGNYVSSDTTAPYTAVWDIRTLTGPHQVRAVAYESTGRTAEHTVTVDVANRLPVVSVTAPAKNSTLHPVPTTFTGTAVAGTGGERPHRIEVQVGSRLLGTATVAEDGTWSIPWDATGQYGHYSPTIRAITPGGLIASTSTWFTVLRPRPVATLESPTTVVRAGAATELVYRVVPGQYDPSTVTQVCLDYYWRYTCGTPLGDGRYRFATTVPPSSGVHTPSLSVATSDGGYHNSVTGGTVLVAKPPTSPSVSWTPGDGTLTVQITPGANYEPIPVLEFVVTAGGQTVRVEKGPVTLQLPNGVTYDVSVAAVNAVGSSEPTTVSARPGTPTAFTAVTRSPSTITYGDQAFLAATLTAAGAPLAGATVALDMCVKSTGGCTEAAAGVTDADGRITLTAKPDQTGSLRLRYAGDETHSNTAVTTTFFVVPKVTMTLSATTVSRTGSVTARATAEPAASGSYSFEVYNGYWMSLTYFNASGAMVPGSWLSAGTWRTRARTYDHATSTYVTSNEVLLTVTE